jgi:hypothetical protein
MTNGLKYRYCTDTQNGFITAANWPAAIRQLHDIVLHSGGKWAWVQDVDGYRYAIGQHWNIGTSSG